MRQRSLHYRRTVIRWLLVVLLEGSLDQLGEVLQKRQIHDQSSHIYE